MEIAPKALYNSLRISFLQNPSFAVETWKVEDYRGLPLEELFLRLQRANMIFDPTSFIAFVDAFDTPEELFDALVADQDFSPEEADRIYLILFELWRRLVPEKLSISIVCDELDYQIFLYDFRKVMNEEPLEDAITAFHGVLVENVDNGIAPIDAFVAISEYLANDFQAFLMDYVSELIEAKEYAYAFELLEQFYAFMPDTKWFDLLHARLIGAQDISKGHELVRAIHRKTKQEPDIDFSLDILAFLVNLPDRDLFGEVLQHALTLVHNEEELQELISITREFFANRHDETLADQLDDILARRSQKDRQAAVEADDVDLYLLKQVVSKLFK